MASYCHVSQRALHVITVFFVFATTTDTQKIITAVDPVTFKAEREHALKGRLVCLDWSFERALVHSRPQTSEPWIYA